jgi:mRNA interferase MazF
VVNPSFVPDVGDVIWLNFSPQAGREQDGRRPALVLSPAAYNGKTSLVLCCPITNRPKGYPFEVPIVGNALVTGVVLSDHVQSLDWRARHAAFKGTVSDAVLGTTQSNIAALLGL